jgi:hypothetical protein
MDLDAAKEVKKKKKDPENLVVRTSFTHSECLPQAKRSPVPPLRCLI